MNRQEYRMLDDSERALLQMLLKSTAEDLDDLIVEGCTAGREQTLARTKLEECIMWAMKGMTG